MKLEELQEKKLTAIAKRLERRLREEGYVKPDYTINYEVNGNTLTMEVDFNYFISDGKQFDSAQRDVSQICSGVGELRSQLGEGAYFGGAVTGSIIRRGKTIKADALLSTCQVTLTFASNFK